jgi:putative PIN family toxin of toxin-antitoxin system
VRIAFDTNVLVSAVATRGLCADLFNLVLAEHELILGECVLAELRRVLREKIHVPTRIIDEYEALLRQEARIVSARSELAVKVRDPSDEAVLSEAVAGNAEVLVTGDRDLLETAGNLPLEILDPRGLWERLREAAQT